jgi:hypothetical protein
MDNSYIDVLVPALKNHPALLGWYHLDEPEANQVTNGLGWPLNIIEQWYHEIKKWDPYHPTFLSYGAYQVNDDKSVNEVYTFKKSFPMRNNNIYDVLMEDHYIIDTVYKSPSPNLVIYDKSINSLINRFIYDGKNGTSGTTMLIEQGYGDGLPPLRDPTLEELNYEIMSYLNYAQSISKYNAGGIMFWRYRIASPRLKNDISKFNDYFLRNHLDRVISYDNQNSLVRSSTLRYFLRVSGDTLFLFAINPGNATISSDLTIAGNGLSQCEELLISSPYKKSHVLKSVGSDYLLYDTFSPFQAKVYLIQSKPSK